jgi:hypothetical protein
MRQISDDGTAPGGILMGDRICIVIRDGRGPSPALYCHWAGMRALKCLHEAVEGSRAEASNVLCNLVVRVMEGMTHDSSYYLYRDDDGAADGDNWTWTYDITEEMWTTTHPRYTGRKKMTRDEVDDIVRSQRPEIYVKE